MKTKFTTFIIALLLMFGGSVQAQQRGDVMWAREVPTSQPFKLDGNLTETQWSKAETLTLKYGQNAPGPTSGWFIEEAGTNVSSPSDPLEATVKFLIQGNQLWLGFDVNDNSIGGQSGLWAVDGILMAVRSRIQAGDNNPHYFGSQTWEHIYSWWLPKGAAGGDIGAMPRFHGAWGADDNSLRTAEAQEAWNAATVIKGKGKTNDDSGDPDVGYTVEMRVDLAKMGYDRSVGGRDFVELSLGIEDTDYRWPKDDGKYIATRTWWQGRWGNTFSPGAARIYFDPAVTVNTTTALPVVKPSFVVPNGKNEATPTIDGKLTEAAWTKFVSKVKLKQGDLALAKTLPEGSFNSSGWWTPDVNGGPPQIIDPSTATFKWFFKDNMLYLGMDVDDQAVSTDLGDELNDGVRFTINTRGTSTNYDNTLHVPKPYQFLFTVGKDGKIVLGQDLTDFLTKNPGAVTAAMSLKGASTISNAADVDTGYQFEIAIDLTKLGYPADRGDGGLFLSATYFDGDLLQDKTKSYGTRIWWTRERDAGAYLYGYMDPNITVGTAIENIAEEIPSSIELQGNYPNPFNPSTTIRYVLPMTGKVAVEVFDILGRNLYQLDLGTQNQGQNEFQFNASGLSSGMYFYRVTLNGISGKVQSKSGNLVLMK